MLRFSFKQRILRNDAVVALEVKLSVAFPSAANWASIFVILGSQFVKIFELNFFDIFLKLIQHGYQIVRILSRNTYPIRITL